MLMGFGAFVTISPGKDGMVHVCVWSACRMPAFDPERTFDLWTYGPRPALHGTLA